MFMHVSAVSIVKVVFQLNTNFRKKASAARLELRKDFLEVQMMHMVVFFEAEVFQRFVTDCGYGKLTIVNSNQNSRALPALEIRCWSGAIHEAKIKL